MSESRINSPRDGWRDHCSIITRHSCSWNDSHFYFLWSFITTRGPWCIYESDLLGLLALVNVQDSSDWQASFCLFDLFIHWHGLWGSVCICESPLSHPLLQTAEVRWGARLPMRTVLRHSPACAPLRLHLIYTTTHLHWSFSLYDSLQKGFVGPV